MTRLVLPTVLMSMALMQVAFGSTSGTSINLNFGANDASPNERAALNATETAGIIPSANWINLSGATGAQSSLMRDSLGVAAPTAASVSWSAAGTWGSVGHNAEINNDFIGSDRVLMKGYLDTSGGVLDTSIIVSGLGPEFSGGYDVYVYALSSVGSDGRGGRYSIGSIIKFGDTGNNGPPDVNGPLYVEDPGVDHLDKGNYLVFHGITGDSFTLIAHPEVPLAGPKRASVNGVQIVAIPDPGCLLWLTVGGCLLFAHRRLRR